MSGWIKFEKDLLTDPRVLRVAKNLASRYSMSEVTGETQMAQFGNDHALPAVTLVCGALARMWVLADTHIGSDNILPLGCDEIDDILEIPGFCSLLPEDWLIVIDESHVQLPEFHEHNGTEAKKKAVTQKRVARWRSSKNDDPLPARNAKALPDQDQTKTRKDHQTESAEAPPPAKTSDPKKRPSRRCPSDFEVTDDLKFWASTECPGVDIVAQTKAFRDYEFRNSHTDWPATWRTWMRKAQAGPAGRVNGANEPRRHREFGT